MHRKFPVRKLAVAAVTAAMYVALSCVAYTFNAAFGAVQFRLSEALTLLPFLFPETVWGLFAGCFLTNLLSMYGPVDLVFGSLATLLAALWTAKCRSKWTAAIPPVVCNGLVVSAVIAYAEAGFAPAFLPVYAVNVLSISLSEAILCFVPGIILVDALKKSGAAEKLRAEA